MNGWIGEGRKGWSGCTGLASSLRYLVVNFSYEVVCFVVCANRTEKCCSSPNLQPYRRDGRMYVCIYSSM